MELSTIQKKNIKIRKRNGSLEDFSPEKLKRVINWATDNTEWMTEDLIKDTRVVLHQNIKIDTMFKLLVETATKKVSMIYPQWEFVASKLMLIEMLSNLPISVKDKKYPHLKDIIHIGIGAGVYDSEIMSYYTDDDLEILNNEINIKYDYSFTISALQQFNVKYCKNYRGDKKLEMPQFTFMRVAMGLAYNLPNRVKFAIDVYKILSKAQVTFASPIMINSGTPLKSYASCILNTLSNDTWDIMNKNSTCGLYTKGRGGLAFDVSLIQSKGSRTNNNVTASGIVPYIQNIEKVVNSMMQSDTRRGSAVITCAWWHSEIEDFLVLKDASGGTESNRALHLKYSFGTNDFLYEALINDDIVYLFNPKDTPNLNITYGDDWKKEYKLYCDNKRIKRKEIKARDLFKLFLKYRFQTGNIYEILIDNVNKTTMTDRYIGSSNLCSEILEPSRGGELIKEYISHDGTFITNFKDEEIAICNLCSINADTVDLPRKELDRIVYTAIKALDNTIDITHYMRVAGEYTNKKYRYIGVGISNYAHYLAKNKTKFEDAEELTFKMSQTLYQSVIFNNTKLAEELGVCEGYSRSRWAQGYMPLDFANKELLNEFKHLIDHDTNDHIRDRIKRFGVRNTLMMAVAPTASSGATRGFTEGIEPILNYSYELRGAFSCKVIVPDFKELNKYYSLAYDIDPKKLIKLNAIRQMFIDQSQSFNMYLTEKHWDYATMAKLHVYAWRLGMKTQYYLNTPKMDNNLDTCDSCST